MVVDKLAHYYYALAGPLQYDPHWPPSVNRYVDRGETAGVARGYVTVTSVDTIMLP